MGESGKLTPSTQHELSATLDVTWRAISAARSNMRVLTEGRDALEASIAALKKELEQARLTLKEFSTLERQLKADVARLQKALDAEKARAEDLGKPLAEALGKLHAVEKQLSESKEQNQILEERLREIGEAQESREKELAMAREGMARLTEEKERLQRELAEALDELAERDAQLANDKELGDALQVDLGLLRQSMAQIDARLETQAANPILTSAHKDKRVVWIGAAECGAHDLFAGYGMEELAASNTQEALELISTQAADGLIADMSVTGLDWLSDVRKRWPGLAIIVMAGGADGHPETDTLLRSIATTVIPQTYGQEEIVATVRSAFLRRILSDGTDALDAGRGADRPRLLVAEDDEITRSILSACLDKCGYDTVCVEDGVAALEALELNAFDVLLTDILMPRMDGIELTTKLKMLKPKLPVIVLSAADDVASSLKALRAGAYCYVPKPANIEELSLAIGRAMRTNWLEKERCEQNDLLEKRTLELEKALRELQEAANLITSRGRPHAEPRLEPAACSVG